MNYRQYHHLGFDQFFSSLADFNGTQI